MARLTVLAFSLAPLSRSSLPFRSTLAHSAFMVGPEGLDQLPLVWRELAANGQQIARIGLFELRAGLRHLVDLAQDLGLIGLVVAHQRLHCQLGFFDIAPQVDQRFPMLKKNAVKTFALVVGQLQPLHDLGIVPPAAVDIFAAKGPLDGRPMFAESRT
jgi:hypothetical protein